MLWFFCDLLSPVAQVAEPFAKKGSDCKSPEGSAESCGAEGLTHTFIDQLLVKALGSKVDYEKVITWVKDDNNQGIFDSLAADECTKGASGIFQEKEKVLCLGAAAISITPEREEIMDFLPSYFESGIRVMVNARTDVWSMLWDVSQQILQTVVYLAVTFVIFTMLLFPFAWVLEMLSTASMRGLPIFISRRELSAKTAQLETEWSSTHGSSFPEQKADFLRKGRLEFIEWQSVFNAMKWMAFILMGSKVAFPDVTLPTANLA
jgi:hypothetical protein